MRCNRYCDIGDQAGAGADPVVGASTVQNVGSILSGQHAIIATPEDVDYRATRGLDRTLFQKLTGGECGFRVELQTIAQTA
jgi:hypothetical protein